MIQDPEFWSALSETPSSKVAMTLLVTALHKTFSAKMSQFPSAQVVMSPSIRSPVSVANQTPSSAARGGGAAAGVLSPSNELHEPFLEVLTSPNNNATSSTAARYSSNVLSPSATAAACERRTPTPSSSSPNKGGSAICRTSSVKAKQRRQPHLFETLVQECTVRLLQHTMLFITPLYALRYRMPAMSMSWNSACVIDANTKRLVTFGGASANVPMQLKCKTCVAGDTYIAVLTEDDEVWVSGSLDCGNGSIASETNTDNMRGIAAKVLMIAGHGTRLMCVTKALTVRPLSIVPVNTRSIFPSRLVKFVEVGLGDDCYMVGLDSVVYKTTITQRNVTTPRRVMTLARLPVSRVASGAGFHLMVDECGQVYTLGKNKKGQLGNGLRQDSMRRPYRLVSLEKHFIVQVAAGESHSLALASSGEVYACGSNDSGQLGLGEGVTDVLTMTRIPLPAKCVGIAAGPLGSMFALTDGRLMTCGSNDAQQLGIPPPPSAAPGGGGGGTAAAPLSHRCVFVPTAVPRTMVNSVASTFIDFAKFQRVEFGMISPSADASFASSVAAAGVSAFLGMSGSANSTKASHHSPYGSSTVRRDASNGFGNDPNNKVDGKKCCKCCSAM